MPVFTLNNAIACMLLACFAGAAEARDLDGRWHLTVSNTKRHVEAQATVRFTGEAAPSCMAGAWKRVVVEASSGNATFFPLGGPLAYRFDDGVLTLGQTSICDGYLFLSGKLRGQAVRGTYKLVSIEGSELLGKFAMEQMK